MTREVPSGVVVVHSRCEVGVGDIGAMLLPGCGWVHVRVVSRTAAHSPYPPRDGDWCSLVYVFNGIVADPYQRQAFPVSDLVGPPVLAGDWWEEGFWLPLRSRPFAEGERLQVHCVLDITTHRPRYFDEHGTILPERIEPCARCGVHGESSVTQLVREAHAAGRLRFDFEPGTAILPPPPIKPVKPRKVEPATVSLVFPTAKLPEDFDWESVETLIEERLVASGAGEWTGHGQDMERGELDISFDGKDANAIYECICRALKGSPLAEIGWCLLSPEYDDQPVIRKDLRGGGAGGSGGVWGAIRAWWRRWRGL